LIVQSLGLPLAGDGILRVNGSFLAALLCAALALITSTVARAADVAADESVALVIGLIGEKDKDSRAVGLDLIRTEIKGEAATRQFAAQLPKLSVDAQTGLLSALADRGDAAARPAVIDILKATQDEPVKIAAINAIGVLGSVEDLPLLLSFLSSSSPAEKLAAKAALVRLSGGNVPAAIVAIVKQATDGRLRATLIEVLTTRRALDVLPELLALALDADATVRAAAMASLGQLAGPAQIPGLIAGVLKAEKGGERDAAERAVALVCSRTSNPEQRADALLAAIDKLSPIDRAAALPTVGRVGGPVALTAVEVAIADPVLHEAGLRALSNWPDASVAPQLFKVLQADEHAEHRALALTTLVRIAPLSDKRSNDQRLALLKQVMGLCTEAEDQNRVIKRASAIYTVETLRFVVPYLDQPEHAQQACETVVELAHHRDVRDANKADFMPALDKVIATSKDAAVVDRAERYKAGKTWVRP
jgi:HEAT repeat protein